jgi:hypothetical protein
MGYIIVIIIVIYLIYLLIKHVIIPLVILLAKVTAVLGVVVLVASIAAAFVVSIVNYIRSFISNINPYKTYIDKNPNKPEGAARNYFFGPGRHQIGMIIKGAWSNNSKIISTIWGWLS